MNCPECGNKCDREEVDIGVGVQIGPWYCINCNWHEKLNIEELDRLDELNPIGNNTKMIKLNAKPKIITFCGSTKFRKEYEEQQVRLTLEGNIVISVGLFGHLEGLDMEGETKKMLDELHLRKIDIADEIFVINPGGYIGSSTKNEIEYARLGGKKITYLEDSRNSYEKEIDELKEKIRKLETENKYLLRDVHSNPDY